jgi:protein-L-isoaspartate(D-aspartate) O-methyltransferase
MSETSLFVMGLLFLIGTCAADGARPPGGGEVTTGDDHRREERVRMVRTQLAGRDIQDPVVLEAMRSVPRHLFVPPAYREHAYDDRPLPIGHSQTISQPYIVALMTQLVRPREGMRTLDVGTGSGYQAAVLAACGAEVFSVEIIPALADEAAGRLAELDYERVTVRAGDGWAGWKEHAPFDAIVVAAAPRTIPPDLVEQLAPGGRMVLPLGDSYQLLVLVEKDDEGRVTRRQIAGVRFVPMTGEAEKH